jgi:hypothetical protein
MGPGGLRAAVLAANGDAAGAVCAARATSVAGTQSKISTREGRAATEAATASIWLSCGPSPFIFQLPAIKGCIHFSHTVAAIEQTYVSQLQPRAFCDGDSRVPLFLVSLTKMRLCGGAHIDTAHAADDRGFGPRTQCVDSSLVGYALSRIH